jgi:TPR repeat protein
MIPLPLDLEYSTMQTCCSTMICDGCSLANKMRQLEESLDQNCPFCRKPAPTEEESNKYNMKRIEANDPVAMREEGSKYYNKGDYSSAFEYYTKAAKLGDVEVHNHLAVLYHDGQGVDRDEKKEKYHLEEAAIGGHPRARYNLALMEGRRYGRYDRAMKHYIIAAGQGHDGSLKWLVENFKRGLVKKEVLDAALRAHQAAVDETKSPQREEAKEIYRDN